MRNVFKIFYLLFFTEPDGKLMVLVVADTDTLLLYEGTTLKWSAQLPFTPVAIARAHFQVNVCYARYNYI